MRSLCKRPNRFTCAARGVSVSRVPTFLKRGARRVRSSCLFASWSPSSGQYVPLGLGDHCAGEDRASVLPKGSVIVMGHDMVQQRAATSFHTAGRATADAPAPEEVVLPAGLSGRSRRVGGGEQIKIRTGPQSAGRSIAERTSREPAQFLARWIPADGDCFFAAVAQALSDTHQRRATPVALRESSRDHDAQSLRLALRSHYAALPSDRQKLLLSFVLAPSHPDSDDWGDVARQDFLDLSTST